MFKKLLITIAGVLLFNSAAHADCPTVIDGQYDSNLFTTYKTCGALVDPRTNIRVGLNDRTTVYNPYGQQTKVLGEEYYFGSQQDMSNFVAAHNMSGYLLYQGQSQPGVWQLNYQVACDSQWNCPDVGAPDFNSTNH
jgi:hypothetical protein